MWILDSYFRFISCLNAKSLFTASELGGKLLKQNMTLKQRKELEAKMIKVFRENIKMLSAELQKILVDDLVTAFQNRVNVLIRAQKKTGY